MVYHFNPDVAAKYNLDCAVFMEYLLLCWHVEHCSLRKNDPLPTHFVITTKELAWYFRFWNAQQISSVQNYCIENNLITVTDLNENESAYRFTEFGDSLLDSLKY